MKIDLIPVPYLLKNLGRFVYSERYLVYIYAFRKVSGLQLCIEKDTRETVVPTKTRTTLVLRILTGSLGAREAIRCAELHRLATPETYDC